MFTASFSTKQQRLEDPSTNDLRSLAGPQGVGRPGSLAVDFCGDFGGKNMGKCCFFYGISRGFLWISAELPMKI